MAGLITANCKVAYEDIATQVCGLKPTKVCGVEKDGAVISQSIAADVVCTDVVSKLCVPAVVAADGCHDVTKKVCLGSNKIVDHASVKIPAPFDSEAICRIIPKGECKEVVHKVAKTVCEPVELPKFTHVLFGK